MAPEAKRASSVTKASKNTTPLKARLDASAAGWPSSPLANTCCTPGALPTGSSACQKWPNAACGIKRGACPSAKMNTPMNSANMCPARRASFGPVQPTSPTTSAKANAATTNPSASSMG